MAADTSQLERALINADAAGDTDAATALAGEIKRVRASVKLPSADPAKGMPWYQKAWTGLGGTFPNAALGIRQLVQSLPSELEGGAPPEQVQQIQQDRPGMMAPLQAQIDEAKANDAHLGGFGATGRFAGNVGMSLPFAGLPGANTLGGSVLVNGLMGMIQPVASGESRGENTLFGAGLGGAGYGIGAGAGAIVKAAANKASALKTAVTEKAAAAAAAETASAKSAAGTAAQNAYRQLEHLRELGALRSLSPEEAQVAAQLEKELAGKAAEKLLPAAAQKEATAAAYKEAVQTEAQRAEEMAAKKLSGSEAQRQFMERFKRYGPAAIGGAVGHFLIPGLGTAGGAATGLVLRPAIRSARNFLKDPAVQYGITSRIGRLGLLDDPNVPPLLGLLGANSNSLLPYTAQQ
jgi:hypothetical protein